MTEDEIPYMNETEIVHLMKYINRNTELLEIGGGGSTIFLSKFVKKIVTVEHNKEWAGKMFSVLQKSRKNNWTLHIAEPNFPQQHPFQPAQPGQFDRYINHIRSLDEVFDVILIDGRDRVRSVEATVDKLKRGGYMIIHDFWNRPKYHSVLNISQLKLITEKNSFPHGEIKDTLVILKKL
jgi:predicted O-methyltransferase YrrM